MRWLWMVSLALGAGDAPEISRSVGRPGGIVVLWPRVGAEAGVDPALAARVQTALATVARGVATDVDVRPQPERVCPRPDGCKGVAVGAVLSTREGGCAVVATVSAPGASAATLVPWVGSVSLREATVAFREPPESRVVINDYARCVDIDGALTLNTEALVAAIRAASP